MLLIYGEPEGWGHPFFLRAREALTMSEAERAELTEGMEKLFRQLTESGELVGGQALAEPGSARTVRVRDGVSAITDGPYIEAKEQLAGYFIVECASRERAIEIVAGFPDARFGAVEVRPLLDLPAMEELAELTELTEPADRGASPVEPRRGPARP
jgi:hypothetical protein